VSARLRQGPIDWFVIALSPALVMGMIMAFLFFLTNIFFGADDGNAPWNYYLFWYIFGMVLTARISMAGGFESRFKAPMYSLILTVAVWFYISGIMPGPGIPGLPKEMGEGNKVLRLILSGPFLAIAWYLAWKITFDVTDIDDKSRLDSSGLADTPPEVLQEDAAVRARKRAQKKGEKIEVATKYDLPKQRRPGAWVVMFAVFCLPFFALGQALIPPEETARRVGTLYLAGWFMGSALGLLMTTFFLSLRIYLTRRGIEMPSGMALGWLSLGALLIAAVVGVSLLFPHPDSGNFLGKFLPNKDAHQGGTDLARAEGAKGKGDKEVGKFQKVDNKEGKKAIDGKEGKGGQKKDEAGGKEKGNNQAKAKKNEKGNDPPQGKKNDKADEKGQKADPNQKEGDPKQGKQAKEGQQDPPQGPSELQQKLSYIMRVIMWCAMLPVAIALFIFFGRAFSLHPSWLQDWLDWFFGLFRGEDKPAKAGTVGPDEPEPVWSGNRTRFLQFENPFDTGEAAHMNDEQLVDMTSEALLAWAHDAGFDPEPGETFEEFVARLGAEQKKQRLGKIVPYHQLRNYYKLTGSSSDCKTACKEIWNSLT